MSYPTVYVGCIACGLAREAGDPPAYAIEDLGDECPNCGATERQVAGPAAALNLVDIDIEEVR